MYGITDPIEKVTLSGPVGANGAEDTIELQNNDDTIDYFLWSQDLFVLYNDESVKNGRNLFEVQRQLQADHSGKRLQDLQQRIYC